MNNTLVMKTRFVFSALLSVVASASFTQNLLRNPSFEDVPNGSLGQGVLPNDWYQASILEPGADTYSEDGTYGLFPEEFGNFTVGTTAFTGNRFVAGWSLDPGESMGQTLSKQLKPRARYRVSAWLHDSTRAFQLDDGGYDVYLTDGILSEYIGHLYATGGGTDAWQFSEFVFRAPQIVTSLSEIVFQPVSLGAQTAYFGLDDVSLTLQIQSIGPRR